jgi:hypothetical protein
MHTFPFGESPVLAWIIVECDSIEDSAKNNSKNIIIMMISEAK